MKNDRLFLGGYFGRDVFNFKARNRISISKFPGVIRATARWNHLFTDRLFMNTSLILHELQVRIRRRTGCLQLQVIQWHHRLQPKDRFHLATRRLAYGQVWLPSISSMFSVPKNASRAIREMSNSICGKRCAIAHDAAVYVNDEYESTTVGRSTADFDFPLPAKSGRSTGMYEIRSGT